MIFTADEERKGMAEPPLAMKKKKQATQKETGAIKQNTKTIMTAPKTAFVAGA